MNGHQDDAYDRLWYQGFPLPQAHPNRLATLATLMGMTPVAVPEMRVLEIGCGDGTHLIATALGLPGASCLGIDLAKSGIDVGNSTIQALGLTNLRLEQCDLMEFDAGAQQFDCIIA